MRIFRVPTFYDFCGNRVGIGGTHGTRQILEALPARVVQRSVVVNKLIERIEIHNNEKKHSHNNVKVDIYFTAIGMFDIPTEQELLKAVEELKNHKQHTEKSA